MTPPNNGPGKRWKFPNHTSADRMPEGVNSQEGPVTGWQPLKDASADRTAEGATSDEGPVTGWQPLKGTNTKDTSVTGGTPPTAESGLMSTATVHSAGPSRDQTSADKSSHPPVITWRPLRSRGISQPAPNPPSLKETFKPTNNTKSRQLIHSVESTAEPPVWLARARAPIKWPQQSVKIDPPRAPVTRPAQSPVTITAALITALLALLTVWSLFDGTPIPRGVRGWLRGEYLTAIATLVGTLGTVASYFYERHVYHDQVRRREERYNARLDQWRATLREHVDCQRDISQQVFPQPSTLVLAQQPSPDLWSRSPEDDDDFLELRLGTGAVLPKYQILAELPTTEGDEPDPLLVKAQRLVDEFQRVNDCAVTLQLRMSGPTCIQGDWDQTKTLARSLLIQLAAYHSPDDLRIVLVFPEAERSEWEWARWLPHVWNDGRRKRFLSTNPAATVDMLKSIDSALREKLIHVARSAANDNIGPIITFVFADPDLLNSSYAGELTPLLRFLMNDGPRLGAHTLFLGRSLRECDTTITIEDGKATLSQTKAKEFELEFVPDNISLAAADAFARKLASVRTPEQRDSERLASVIPLLTLLNLQRIEQCDSPRLWRHSEPFKSLEVTLGRYKDPELFSLDIHRAIHGPHGLVVGARGSGKSSFLQTLIVSLALRYHPSELQFVIFDYKASNQTKAFSNLPHKTSIITSFDSDQVIQALQHLQEELRRRQRILERIKIKDIDGYNFFRRQRPNTLKPMPYILLIADEFTKMVSSNYSFMQKLIETLEVSEDLGLHMIFATSETDQALMEQLRNISNFRLCFQVNHPEESMRVIGRADAARMLYPGQAFFQVSKSGVSTPPELVRVAWANALYDPQSEVNLAHSIRVIALDGERQQPTVTPSQGPTQAEVILNYLSRVAPHQSIG